jgi:hypothetical protein
MIPFGKASKELDPIEMKTGDSVQPDCEYIWNILRITYLLEYFQTFPMRWMVRRVLFKLLRHVSRTKRVFELQISLIERSVTSMLDRGLIGVPDQSSSSKVMFQIIFIFIAFQINL